MICYKNLNLNTSSTAIYFEDTAILLVPRTLLVIRARVFCQCSSD